MLIWFGLFLCSLSHVALKTCLSKCWLPELSHGRQTLIIGNQLNKAHHGGNICHLKTPSHFPMRGWCVHVCYNQRATIKKSSVLHPVLLISLKLAHSLWLGSCQRLWPDENPPQDSEQTSLKGCNSQSVIKKDVTTNAEVKRRQRQNKSSFFSTMESVSGPWRQVKTSPSLLFDSSHTICQSASGRQKLSLWWQMHSSISSLSFSALIAPYSSTLRLNDWHTVLIQSVHP